MITYNGIDIRKEKEGFISHGLVELIFKEISCPKGIYPDDEYFNVFRYIIDYLRTSGAIIKDDETISYKSWILKFVVTKNDQFTLFEANQVGSEYVPGIEYALKVSKAQEDMCAQFDTSASFVTFGQLVVISNGVYEGLPLQGVRYNSPSHMSGWWLTTDLYDGNVKSLSNVHYYHLAFSRPDLLKYLALPFGFRFFHSANGSDIWYDPKIGNK